MSQIIDFRNLVMGRLSWIIQVGSLCHHKSLPQGGRGRFDYRRGRRRYDDQNRSWSGFEEGHENFQTDKEMDSSLEPAERPWPVDTLPSAQ